MRDRILPTALTLLALAPLPTLGQTVPGAPEGMHRSAPLRPVATHSIVARDPARGELGVAVRSHCFSVGSIVTWAEAGVGAVATQSFVEPSYGPLGLQLMRMGRSAPDAHTGSRAISAAGHHAGEATSTQANMTENPTVWDAVALAFENAQGDLAECLLAALEAAEKKGGDIRGKQSAAIIVVAGTSTGKPWVDRKSDLRIEDHPTPVPELRRLVRLQRACNALNDGAMASYAPAMELVPDEATNGEAPFWVGITLAATGREEEAAPFLLGAQRRDARWAELTRRLPAAGLLTSEAVAARLATRMRAGR